MNDREREGPPDDRERGDVTAQQPESPETPGAGGAGGAGAPPATSSGAPGAAPGPVPDLGRRTFFRSFGREAVQAAAQLVGAAAALQRGPLAATGQLLGGGASGDPISQLLGFDDPPASAAPVQLVPPYRYRDGQLMLVDQRRLPDELVEVTCNTGAEVAACIRDRMVAGGPVLAQVATYGTLVAAERVRASTPFIRTATLHGTINALRSSRPASRPMEAALDRMMAAWQRVGEDAPGDVTAEALRAEAAAIVEEAMLDHAALGREGAARMPVPAERYLQVLLHGPVGTLGGGTLGTALEVIQRLRVEGRAVHAWVPEGRPGLDGARLVALELARVDVRHTVIADAAVAAVLARGRVDAILVTAERIARNGDVSASVGTYPLAAVAARHDVPLYVCAPLAAVDLEAADGWSLLEEERPVEELADLHGWRAAPRESAFHNPVLDVTPGSLVRGFVTELGVIEAPYETSLVGAVERRRDGPVPPPAVAGPATAGPAVAGPATAGSADEPRPGGDVPSAGSAPPAEDEDGWAG